MMRWGNYDERLVERIVGAFRGRGIYLLLLLGLLLGCLRCWAARPASGGDGNGAVG